MSHTLMPRRQADVLLRPRGICTLLVHAHFQAAALQIGNGNAPGVRVMGMHWLLQLGLGHPRPDLDAQHLHSPDDLAANRDPS